METTTVTTANQESKASRREAVLGEFIRFSYRATRGLTTAAESEGKELLRRMTEMGRITPEEEARLSKNLLGRMQESRRNFEGRIDASVRSTVEKMNLISRRELAALTEQLARLESRLNELSNRK